MNNDYLINHINEIIGIIQNDCVILLDKKNMGEDIDSEFLQLMKGIAHIQGLCNGLKKHIDKHLERKEG